MSKNASHRMCAGERKPLSRRKFLGDLGAVAAGLLVAPSFRINKVLAGKREGASVMVALTQAYNYDRAVTKARVQHLFDSLGGLSDLLQAGTRVAIKINLTGGSGNASSPGLNGVPITECMWTHPEVLRAVGELLLDSGVRPADLTIVEALWDTGSFTNFGYQEVQQSLGAQMVNLNGTAPYTAFVQRPVGPNKFYYDAFSVNQILSDIDVYVSIPKMKEHYEAGVTASLKNQVGMVPKQLYTLPSDTGRRGALHGQGGPSNTHLPRSICDLNLARPVHLAVIDGIKNARGGEGVWNPTFQLAEDHVLLAGREPVAVDSIAAYLMGHDPEDGTISLPGGGACDNYLDLLHQKGIGTNQLGEIQPVGDGAGLVTSILPSVVHSEPDHFELYQNYPNPFNPSTTFKYYLPRDADISIKIYSITGQEVESLVEGWVPQGLHEVQWAPRGLASGVYLCEMQGAGEKESRKLIYQK